MFLCLSGLFRFLRQASTCYLHHHVGCPGGEHRVSSWHPPGHCPGSCLLICTWLPAPARAPRPPCEDSTRVVLTVPLLPVSSAEIKSRDWQLFALPVVQHKTTTSRAAWFTFTVFLRLTRTICSSSFGICRRIRDLPRRYSPDTQINSLGFKTDSENSAQQWHVAQFLGCVFFFFFLVYFCNLWRERQIDSLKKKGKKIKNASQRSGQLEGRLLWKVPMLHLGKMEIKWYVKWEIELEACQ